MPVNFVRKNEKMGISFVKVNFIFYINSWEGFLSNIYITRILIYFNFFKAFGMMGILNKHVKDVEFLDVESRRIAEAEIAKIIDEENKTNKSAIHSDTGEEDDEGEEGEEEEMEGGNDGGGNKLSNKCDDVSDEKKIGVKASSKASSSSEGEEEEEE